MYVRHKIIKGHQYYYLVEGLRVGRRVKQRVIRYLGKHAGASVVSSGMGVPSTISLPTPPRVFTTDAPRPPAPAEQTPPIREQQPRKVTWIKHAQSIAPITPEDVEVGTVLQRITRGKRQGRGCMGGYRYRVDDWVVTETADCGYFKAIPKKVFDKALREATRTPWIGGAIRASMVLTGHPPARIVLTWFANTDLAEAFTAHSPEDEAPPV